MLSSLRWLALEAWYLERATTFYADRLGLPVVAERDHETVLDAGGTGLVLREPSTVPRGGLHVHYALATTPAGYRTWHDDLSTAFDLREHDFGGSRSLYFYDPDDHCVEIGSVGDRAPLDGIFEVVLEVEDLDRAEAFYADLGFSVSDRGEERPRVRLAGPVDLELWEPQRGIADARGGVHVDLGFEAADPEAAIAAVETRACAVESLPEGVRIRDPDGHALTVR